MDGIEWTNGNLSVLNRIIHKMFKDYDKGRIAGTDAHCAQHFGYSWTQVDIQSEDPDDLVSALKKGKCRPGGTYVPLPLIIWWSLYSTFIHRVRKLHRVNEFIIPSQDVLRGLRPIDEYDGREWRTDFVGKKKH